MFDSQAEIAALVYGPNDDPDGLLREFADDLRRSGCRVVGLVQGGRTGGGVRQHLPAVAWPTRAAVCLRHNSEPAGCRLDQKDLAETRRWIAAAIREGADLVIINRFGKLEAAGAGFVDEIKRAVAVDIPVLIAVPHWRFMVWTRFCAGMAVKLACARAPIDAWWRTVARRPGDHRAPSGATFCEIAK
jgi:nucleoside-triphosphatase THEP1